MEKRRLRIEEGIFQALRSEGLLEKHRRNHRPCSKIGFVGCRDPRCHFEHAGHLREKHGLIAVGYPLFGGGFRLSEHAPIDVDFWTRVTRMTFPSAELEDAFVSDRDFAHRQSCLEAIASGVLLLGIDILNLDVHGPKCSWASMHGVGLHHQLWFNHSARLRVDSLAHDGRWIKEAREFGREMSNDRFTVYETLHWHTDQDTGHDGEAHATWRIEPEHELFQRFSMAQIKGLTEEQFLAALVPDHPALALTGQEVPIS